MLRRISDHELKQRGGLRINTMNAFVCDNVIFSYGLPVAVKDGGEWVTCHGRHDYSVTTSKQVSTYTGISTKERRKTWKFVCEDELEQLIKNQLLWY